MTETRNIPDTRADDDVQVTLAFADGTVHTFPILRDRGMRWRGEGTAAPLVAVEAVWFHNPTTRSEA